MARIESGVELFKTLHDQLIDTRDPRDAKRAGIIETMLEARGSDLIYNPQDDARDLLEKRGMTQVTIGVSSMPPANNEHNLEKQDQSSQAAASATLDELKRMQEELFFQIRQAEMEMFKPYCKGPEQFEACRKLMDGQDMTGWEVATAFRIIQTNGLPVYFVPREWLLR